MLERISNVPAHRILLNPPPGTATEADLLDSATTGGRDCELVGGILIERPTSFWAGLLPIRIASSIYNFTEKDNLGVVAGSRGAIHLASGLVRMPSLSFIRWDSVDDTDVIENPDGAFLEAAPDLVVEVLCPDNTTREMAIKLDEYAKAGVRLVWYVDPTREEVTVYPKGRERGKKVVGTDGVIDGGDVLPGFVLPVAKIFEKRGPTKKGKKKDKS
ncbi:Uma2 family endonuclease [Fimbriiglobus ruber]|nr:Uma2 family endonuclease [Fimbriiglobus ruber]